MNDELKIQLRRETNYNALLRITAKAADRIEQLERELAEARKDKRRLDWLTSQKGCAVDEGPKGFWLYWYDGFVVKTFQDSEFPTARAAIDAAIAKDKP